jgi:hypothetical protein
MRDRNEHPITTGDEQHERDLNRHRATEQRDARAEVLGRLDDRGIDASDAASVDALVDLLEAVEAFERAVEAHGGDLMVDTPPSRQPDDGQFMLPRRGADESVSDFAHRVRAAAGHLR